MRPAFQIMLEPASLQLIGEICAIQGQIEWAMLGTVRQLLGVERRTAQHIMGSTSIAANAQIWLSVVNESQCDDETKDIAGVGFKRLAALAEGRNDFLHAVYGATGTSYPNGVTEDFLIRPDLHGLPKLAGKGNVAMRVRNQNIRDVADLKLVRDEAAFISVVAAHVQWVSHDRETWGNEPSPWLDILAKPHPSSLQKPAPRKATKHYDPPRS